MNTTLLNTCTKFGAKIFRRYQVITFYVLGHFLAAPCSRQCGLGLSLRLFLLVAL